MIKHLSKLQLLKAISQNLISHQNSIPLKSFQKSVCIPKHTFSSQLKNKLEQQQEEDEGEFKEIIPQSQNDDNFLQHLDINDPQIQNLVQAIQQGDKKLLNKILQALQAVQHYQSNLEQRKFDFSPKFLTETEVYRIIQKVQEMPEDKMITMINQENQTEVQDYFNRVIRQRLTFIPTFQLIKILKSMKQNDKELKHMSINEISNLVYLFSHANKQTKQFFRDIENELMERDFEFIPIDCIQKLLKGFSYCNLGSSMIYNKIAKSIKLAQYEIDPLKLGQYAYMYSKASESIKAGFGVYHIAEQRITQFLYRYNITQLTKLAKFFMSQKIGSNQFLTELEKEIISKYPKDIQLNILVKYAKFTSKYYFLYNDKALFYKIEADCIKNMSYMSTEQLGEVVWSYGRGKTGSYILYEKIEEEVMKKVKLFTVRQLVFIYHSMCLSGRGSKQFFDIIENQILEKNIAQFEPHYIVKLINGINVKNNFESKLFQPIMKKLEDLEINLEQNKTNYSQIITFLYLLIQTPPFYLNYDNQSGLDQKEDQSLLNDKMTENHKFHKDKLFQQYQKLFQKYKESLQSIIPHLRVDELCQIYIAYSMSNNGDNKFFEQIQTQIGTAYDVPKPYFSQFLYSLCQQHAFDFAIDFLPIIQDLRKYGNIKYFFSHDDFVRLIYSAVILTQIKQEGVDERKYGNQYLDIQFWDLSYDSLMEINPNTLKFQVVPIYMQTLLMVLTQQRMSEKYSQQQENFQNLLENAYKKMQTLTQSYKEQIVMRDVNNFNDLETKSDIFEHVTTHIKNIAEKQGLKYQILLNFVDDMANTIDVALFLQNQNEKGEEQIQKIAVCILNKYHYKQSGEEGNQEEIQQNKSEDNLILSNQIKLGLLQDILEWNIILVDEDNWQQLSSQEKILFFQNQIELESSEFINQQSAPKTASKKKRKTNTKKFSEKLSQKKSQ
ncbi:hypothetical protein PPERSA_08608 [Pseudocohnilembus persalinus]|uniref:Uncharacterized protein n=1 Tax=Pseudocohnilembus persalinus TaxID=266149 RepID=A0A0V0R1L3_PSEPJ|nr:hypothetical protein PPERSA_08608 [Pseudocohnilembus persalinus]|eukprot:KRX08409.1 hypothetical protein PPERSA_08608 [Pseudocohnilembus persalinus]